MKRFLTQSLYVRLLSFVIVNILLSTFCQAQSWTWAVKGSGKDDDRGHCIDVDNNGNVYVTGFFTDTLSIGRTTLFGAGYHDIFIAKYTPNGQLLWAKKAGGKYPDESNAIKVDSKGNCYITGSFNGQAAFGENTTEIILKSNSPVSDIFIAKYSSDGELLWAQKAGGKDVEDAKAIALDKTGNVFITGYFGETASFGTGASSTAISNTGGEFDQDIFIAKYDSEGNFIWVKNAGGAYSESGTSVDCDNSGNIFITGYFAGEATFGGKSITSEGETDIFIARYAANGDITWVQNAGGAGFDGEVSSNVAIDNAGNCHITGNFAGTATFGKDGFSKTLTSKGFNDIYIASINSEGDLLWAYQAGGPRAETGSAISVDNMGNTFITGNFAGDAQFGPNTISANAQDIYVAKYDINGNNLWVKNAGGNGNDYGMGICTDLSGNVYITGMFESTASFGNSDSGNTLTCEGFYDIFSAKISEEIILSNTATALEASINTYPNPLNDYLIVELKNNISEKTILTLSSITGSLLLTEEITKAETKVSMSQFPPAVYFLHIKTGEKTLVRKIVKQ